MCSLCSHYTKGIADEEREIECGGQKGNFERDFAKNNFLCFIAFFKFL
jgi:hypothetical protein